MHSYSLPALFEQLQLDSSPAAIRDFLTRHQLSPSQRVWQATCWSPTQAQFLQQAAAPDSPWQLIVSELRQRLQGAQRVMLFYNPNSGTLLARAEESVHDFLSKHTRQLHPQLAVTAHEMSQTAPTPEQLIQSHLPDAVWVAGGDGSVLAMADIVHDLNIPLGIIPGGTMNLMARDLGMALELDQAIEQLATAKPQRIDMGYVNQQPFLCLSNLGMSTRLTERREKLRQHVPWIRWPLMAWYMLKYMFSYPKLDIVLTIEGETRHLQSRSLTISNNMLAPQSSLIPERRQLNQGQLGVYVARNSSIWSLPRLIVRLFNRDWQNDKDMLIFQAQQVSIQMKNKRRKVRVMSDGELNTHTLPLTFHIQPGALLVLTPNDPP